MFRAIAGITLMSLSAFAIASADKPGEGVKVQPVQSNIAEETFQTLLVAKALEELGYDVASIKAVDYSAAYAAISNGDATFLAVNWDPLHSAMYNNAGGDEVFFRQGKYINGAAQGYLIDKKTADAYAIDNIGDFKDPKIAKLFDTNDDGKADLTGCQPGWGCEAVIEHHLDAFDLRDSITHNQGQYAAIISDTITRYNNDEPIFYYTWTPYWVSGVLIPGKDVVWLEVPFSSLPYDDNADTRLANGKDYGFQINSERIVANREWSEKNPAAAKLFSIMELNIHDVSAQNMMIREGEDSEKEMERHADAWIKAHRKTWDGWLEQARAAAE